ncbi:hypothetical protein ACKEPO_17555 [Acinetobacter baumannii]|uniref:hypothetical protein n=1 Tax=Acinetobacter baumannii TaxID=470 RepID=UPI0029573DD5|nr:hypothetical protein [Acinetobacter baumannii]MDV7667318.1 hypothetical protein [Acinetobacter baumannii]
MKKIFHTYIKKYQFLTPERLYGEYVKYFETNFTKHESTIYFIAKCKKIRWIPESIKFLRNYEFSALVEIDGKINNIIINMADYWYAMEKMQRVFINKESMASSLMGSHGVFKFLPPDLRYKNFGSVVGTDFEGRVLKINCALKKSINADKNSIVDICLYQAINYYNLPKPMINIIYIGSSLKETFSRLQEHEKWGWIQAQKRPDEDILVYFCETEGAQLDVKLPFLLKKDHTLSKKEETLITEIALINYFKPSEYNKHYVDSNIEDSKYIKSLVKKGFHQINIEMILNGNMAQLGSIHLGKYGNHNIYYEIK